MVLQVKAVDQTGESGTTQINLALVQVTIGNKKYNVDAGRHIVKGPSKTATVVKKTGIGAAIGCGVGATIGRLVHHTPKGCVVGATAGGATGYAVSRNDQPKPAVLAAGSVVRFNLSKPLSIS